MDDSGGQSTDSRQRGGRAPEMWLNETATIDVRRASPATGGLNPTGEGAFGSSPSVSGESEAHGIPLISCGRRHSLLLFCLASDNARGGHAWPRKFLSSILLRLLALSSPTMPLRVYVTVIADSVAG